jgi:hypothetical protein
MRELNFIDRSIQYLAKTRGLTVQPADSYSPDFSQVRNLTSGVNVNHETALKFSAVFAAKISNIRKSR